MTDDTEQCATHIHTTVQRCPKTERREQLIEQVNTAGNEEGSFSGVIEGTIDG